MIATALVMAGGAWLGLTWVGYPLALSCLPKRPWVARTDRPKRVAIVCVVRDERARIARRLEELAALERHGLEVSVIVVDDGSVDGTAEVARSEVMKARSSGSVEVVSVAPMGKARAIEVGLTRVGDVDAVVFCDVRQRIPPGALRELLEPFRDPAVGAVSGVVVKPAETLAGRYWRYESWVRRLEARTGSVVGATGPWHALRAEALPTAEGPAREGLLLDDVWLPMQAVLRGWRAVVAEGAVVHDVEHVPSVERQKKARTLTGNLQLAVRWPALWSRKNPVRGRFVWHKLMRLATPVALGAVVLGPVVGALMPGPLQGLWTGVVLAAGLGAAAVLATPAGREALGLVGAMAQSWVRFARGDFRW